MTVGVESKAVRTVGRPPKPERLRFKNRVTTLLNDAQYDAVLDYIKKHGLEGETELARLAILKLIDFEDGK